MPRRTRGTVIGNTQDAYSFASLSGDVPIARLGANLLARGAQR